MARMPAFGLDGPGVTAPGSRQTMECITGMAARTGYPDGLPTLVRGACDPVAGIQAAFAVILALGERDRRAEGLHVEIPMVEAALNVAAEAIVEWSAGGTVLAREGNRGPDACPQGVYACAGPEQWVAVAVAGDEQWAAFADVVDEPWTRTRASRPGRPGSRPTTRSTGTLRCGVGRGRRPRWSRPWPAPASRPAEVVVPRKIAHNPQLLADRRLFEVENHPVTGGCSVPG